MDPQAALDELQSPTPLSILTISHPILASLDPSNHDRKRFSDDSNTSDQEARTPSAIQADLVHYQELFAKLRFSYVEQVTKERFLRAVTAETPEFVDGTENAELEAKLREDKAGLKEKKVEVRGMIGDLEEQGRSLAQRRFPCSETIERGSRDLTLIRLLRSPTPNHPTLRPPHLNRRP